MWSSVRVIYSRKLCPPPLSLSSSVSSSVSSSLSSSLYLARSLSLSLSLTHRGTTSLPRCLALARFFSEGRSGSPPAGSPVSTEQVGKGGRAVSEDDVSKSESIRPLTTVFFSEFSKFGLCRGVLADVVAQPCKHPLCGEFFLYDVVMRQLKC